MAALKLVQTLTKFQLLIGQWEGYPGFSLVTTDPSYLSTSGADPG